jgi:hypothetical protein
MYQMIAVDDRRAVDWGEVIRHMVPYSRIINALPSDDAIGLKDLMDTDSEYNAAGGVRH